MSIIVRVRGKQRDPKGKASNLKLEGQMRSGYPGKHRSVAYLLALAGPLFLLSITGRPIPGSQRPTDV